ncbi:desmoplakin [Psilogramma increta granulovirus]|uniref:Desmoplakin n=1 Tax=Psilogramma increta granulovirus TaxID=2953508 RepID=A0A977TNZ2_9BBAC|nr:desmoplakin [Psilogramma increta granulovirus]
MTSLPPTAFLFNKPSNDMILTRYKGVDVTPHTFNNLIKTITNQRSINNTSTSKNDFEDRIREIILAFNPTLKKNGAYMTTEYMLVNTLKGTDKKEVTHTYNYNNWGASEGHSYNDENDVGMDVDDNADNFFNVNKINKKLKLIATGEWNNDKMEQLLDLVYSINEPCVRKINKKYTKYVDELKRKYKRNIGVGERGCGSSNNNENNRNNFNDNDVDTLVLIKQMLNVKKLDNNQLVVLCETIKNLLFKYNNNDNDNNNNFDSVEKYVHGFRVLCEKINKLQQDVKISKDEKNKLAELTRQQILDEIQTDTLALKNQIEAQNRKINTLTNQNEHFNDTITQNVIEIAKLGGEAGEKDVYIEELQNDLQQCRKQLVEMKQYEETINDLNCCIDNLRGENTKLDNHNDELLKTNSRLNLQIQQILQELNQKNDNLNTCNQHLYSILNKKDEDDKDKERTHIATIENLTKERDILLHDKQYLQKIVDECKEFEINIKIRMQQLETECAIKSNELNQKEQALILCKNKMDDKNVEFLKKLEEYTKLTYKLQHLQQEYNEVVDNNNTIKTKLDNVTNQLNKITQKNVDLLKENEKYYEECDVVMKDNVKLKSDIKKLQNNVEYLESRVNQINVECENKIKSEQEKFEEYKEDFIKQTRDKWLQDKHMLIDKYEKKIEMLKINISNKNFENDSNNCNNNSSSNSNINNNTKNQNNNNKDENSTINIDLCNRKRSKSELKNIPKKLAKNVVSVKPITRK